MSRVDRRATIFLLALTLLGGCGDGAPTTSTGVAVGTPNASVSPVANDPTNDELTPEQPVVPDNPEPPVPEPSVVRWTDVAPSLSTCGNAGCHQSAGNYAESPLFARAHFRTYFNEVYAAVRNGSMPLGGTALTDDQLNQLRAWRAGGFR